MNVSESNKIEKIRNGNLIEVLHEEKIPLSFLRDLRTYYSLKEKINAEKIFNEIKNCRKVKNSNVDESVKINNFVGKKLTESSEKGMAL